MPDSNDNDIAEIAREITLQVVVANRVGHDNETAPDLGSNGKLSTDVILLHKDSDTTCLPQFSPLNPISLVEPTTLQLIPEALVTLRKRHEPSFVTRAIRRSTASTDHSTALSDSSSSPTLRQRLVTRLVTLTHDYIVSGQTTGVARNVRHTGNYTATNKNTNPSTGERHKHTVQSVLSSVSTDRGI